MSAIALIDIVALLAVAAALPAVWLGRRRIFKRDAWWLLFGLLALTLYHHLSNVLEWTGLTTGLDVFEDYAELLLPVMWFVFFFVLIRERSATALRESEQNYRLVVENANEGIFIIQDGVYKYVNAYGLQLFGRRWEDLVGAPILQDVHPEDRDRILKRIQTRLAGKPIEDIVEHRIFDAQGHIK